MKCPQCPTNLEVTHTHTNANSRTSRAVCPACDAVYTLVTTIILATPGRGARALATQLKKGRARVEVLYDEVLPDDEAEDEQESQASLEGSPA